MGCYRKNQAPWTEDEFEFVKENYGKILVVEIANQLPGRTPTAVEKVAKRLGLKIRDFITKPCHEFMPTKFFSSLLLRAKKKHGQAEIDFDEDYLLEMYDKQGRKCALTGWNILFSREDGKTTASVDRIDSTKGYSKSNIQLIHKNINRMKNHFTDEYFYRVCEAVTQNRRDLQAKKIVYEMDDWNDTERIIVLSARGESGFEDVPENCYEYITSTQQLNGVPLQYP